MTDSWQQHWIEREELPDADRVQRTRWWLRWSLDVIPTSLLPALFETATVPIALIIGAGMHFVWIAVLYLGASVADWVPPTWAGFLAVGGLFAMGLYRTISDAAAYGGFADLVYKWRLASMKIRNSRIRILEGLPPRLQLRGPYAMVVSEREPARQPPTEKPLTWSDEDWELKRQEWERLLWLPASKPTQR